MRLSSIILRGLLVVAAATQATAASGVQSENHALHAVPPPGAVVVDGKLDDWDLSGQMECFPDWRARETRSAKVAAMYDKDCFYLAIAWRDATPMHNMNDPQFEAGFGWRSDCVELRMITDLPLHVDCWYSAAAKRPMIVITYGSFNNGPANVSNFAAPNAIDAGAKQAFTLGADGKSYTQEIALPWALITAQGAIVKETGKPYAAPKSYQAGDTLKLMMEFIWGGVDGRTSPGFRYIDLIKEGHTSRDLHPFAWQRFPYIAEDLWGTVKLEQKGRLTLPQPDYAGKLDSRLQKTAGPIKLAYDMPFDGFATLVIEDENGTRVRNLIGMAPRSKGKQLDYWDCKGEGGSESDGKLVPPGKYRFRGLVHKGIAPVYEASYGTPGSPAWDTADGKGGWLSDFWPPKAVAAAKDAMILGTDMTSDIGASIICTDLDGRRKWGDRSWWGIHSLAVDDKYVYVSIYRPRHQRWWDDSAAPALARLDLATGKPAPFATQAGPQLKVSALKEGEKPGATKGIAVTRDRVAVSMNELNVVRFFDKETAAIIDELPVPKPGCLAYDAAGTLHVWSEDKLMKVIDGKLVPLVSKPMKWPDGLAVDANGQIFLADRAAQQVKVYDKGGKLVRSVGLAGGRRAVGTWQPDGMLNPAGLAVDSQGRLWVAEEDFAARRVSVWAAGGQLVMDFMGPAVLRGAADANADPDDKTRLFAHGFEFKLDYDKNKAEPIAATRADTCGEWLKAEKRSYLMSRGGSLPTAGP
ncbi:MAG TPA: hypothetical protein VM141_08050, partial [Planctomycetota bacterium]|nr:hypothetical protein [Planctomycetota bacterium]